MSNGKGRETTAQEPSNHCAVCSYPAHFRCSKCHVTWYCGATHQRQAWPSHKRECKTLIKRRAKSSVVKDPPAPAPAPAPAENTPATGTGFTPGVDAPAVANMDSVGVGVGAWQTARQQWLHT